jgi:hypothetical protein
LEFLDSTGRWQEFEARQTYLVAFDAWLSMNRYGEGPEIKEWIEIMTSRQPIATEPYKNLIARYWTRVLEKNGFGERVFGTCQQLLSL